MWIVAVASVGTRGADAKNQKCQDETTIGNKRDKTFRRWVFFFFFISDGFHKLQRFETAQRSSAIYQTT